MFLTLFSIVVLAVVGAWFLRSAARPVPAKEGAPGWVDPAARVILSVIGCVALTIALLIVAGIK